MSSNLESVSTIGCGDGHSVSSAFDLPSVQLSTIKVSTFITYIKEVVSPALEGRSYVHPSLINLLEDLSCQEKLRRFITDSQVKSILIQRISEDEEASGHSSESNDNIVFSIVEEADYSNPLIGHILIKKSPVLKRNKNISSQLLYMSLNNTSILERFLPFCANMGREDEIITFNENRVTELMEDLLQQNIDVPEINLKVHPAIIKVMIKCAGENRKATVDDCADKIGDSVFLDEMQNEVNRWNERIKKVICLDQNVYTGTTIQEISFWRNLKQDLLRIQKKRKTLQVALTLDILKKGERSHAIASFDDVGTQLQKALVKVNNNQRFLENFPLNDLLSATDLDKIKFAILMIFHHMRKIRDTEYPIRRALKLMETIARDLSTQLIKVLRTKRMMDIPYEEFQKLMRTQREIFDIWLTEYFEMKYLLTILLNKKYVTSYDRPLYNGSELTKLQQRIQAIKSFRLQHEQHFAFIVKELQKVPANNNLATSSTKEMSMEGDFIEEVNQAYEFVKEVDLFDISKEGTETWQEVLKFYKEKFDLVKAQFMVKLGDPLKKYGNADEMFRSFWRYYALFVYEDLAVVSTIRQQGSSNYTQ